MTQRASREEVIRQDVRDLHQLGLASDESRWTNGAHFVIDGGISINYF